MNSLEFFRLEPLVCDLRFGIFHLGSFVWDLSLGPVFATLWQGKNYVNDNKNSDDMNNNNNNKLIMMMMMIGAGDQALETNSLG